MSQIHYPLKDYLIDPVDEAAILRVGARVAAQGQKRRLRWVLPVALAGATALAAIVVTVTRGRHDAGPLLLADGHDVVAVSAGQVARTLALSDGSRVRLSPGARLEPLESSAGTFFAIVTQGRADFEVRPGGPRRWVIECGLATVEVVGTAFSCDREAGRLRIEVRHGAVLVRGERVPERARRLLAGQSLELTEEARSADGVRERSDGAPAAASGAGEAPAAPVAQSHRARTAVTWRDLARDGHNREAFATLGSEGLRRESRRLGVNDLLALADVARLSGHPAEAVVPLERILGEFAADPQAPLAAFALGRLQLDALGHPRAAASAFAKALALGIPAGLREDVRARLVEAFARGGDARAAQRAADAYFSEFPHGRHTQSIQGWLRQQ